MVPHSSPLDAELSQQNKMLPDSRKKATQIVALQALALGSRADDRPKSRIMGVRHVREQVMLNLVVQSAGKPGGNS